MNMFLANTGFTGRDTLIVFLWLRPRNTSIPIQHIECHPYCYWLRRFATNTAPIRFPYSNETLAHIVRDGDFSYSATGCYRLK